MCPCRWIRSYLTDRHQKVVLGGDESNTIPFISVVPQGSVLGPLLFRIYIDDVTRVPLALRVVSKLVIYADDMPLYRKIDCPEDYTMLHWDVNTINNWVRDNSFAFSVLKCKYMLISCKRQG